MSCCICTHPLVDEEDDTPDRVTYPCGDNFHWECIISHSQPPNKCPQCTKTFDPLLVTVESDGGIEQNYDIAEVIADEQAQNANPELRKHTALLDACFVGDEDVVVELVTEDQSIVSKAVDEEKGWTCLFFATVAGRLDLVRFLLDHGADAGYADKNGLRPLDYAIEERYTEIIQLLTDSGRS